MKKVTRRKHTLVETEGLDAGKAVVDELLLHTLRHQRRERVAVLDRVRERGIAGSVYVIPRTDR